MNQIFQTFAQKANMVAVRIQTSSFAREESGADMVEYALVLALVAIVGAVALKPLGSTIASAFSSI